MMRFSLRSLFYLVSVIAAFLGGWMIDGHRPTATVCIAAKDIRILDAVAPEDVRWEVWSLDRVPTGALRVLPDSKLARHNIQAGEVIFASSLISVRAGTINLDKDRYLLMHRLENLDAVIGLTDDVDQQ